MTNSIITLMGLFIIMLFAGYMAIMLYGLTASIRMGYVDADEKYYTYKARRRIYSNY